MMLIQLPVEISTSILSLLDGADLQSARLVSKSVSRLASPIFFCNYFSKVATEVSRASMEKIEALSSVEAYRNAVLMLEVATHTRRFGQDLTWPRDTKGELQDSPNLKRLQMILRECFPNCTKIHIGADEDRQWPNYWTSEEHLTLPEIIEQVFLAMASSSLCIESVKFALSPRNQAYCIEAVRLSAYASESFWAAWAQVKALWLDMDIEYDSRGVALTCDLITKALNLQKLALVMVFCKTALSPSPLYTMLMGADHVPRLSQLVIEVARFGSTEELVTFISRFSSTLQLFSLSNIRARGDWRAVVGAMRGKFRKLNYFVLDSIWEVDREDDIRGSNQLMCPLRTLVPFEARDNFSYREVHDKVSQQWFCIGGVRYIGPDIELALELIEKSLYSHESPPHGLENQRPPPGSSRLRIRRFPGPDISF